MPDAWNVRMTEMQAVLGLSCLRFWDDMRARRARIAQIYRDAGIPCVQDEVEGLRPTWYKYTVRVSDAEGAMREIRARGGRTTARTHGPDENGGRPFGLPGADRLAHRHISLPTAWIDTDEAERLAIAVISSGVVQRT